VSTEAPASMSTPYGAILQPPLGGEMRSVTPAMANIRQPQAHPQTRYPSAPRMGVTTAPNHNELYAASRSMTPNRYLGGNAGYNRNDDTAIPADNSDPRTPSSTGLIRLTLKKPMGIVFEPMYDPNQPSLQRGVRICDLPRTGAAALSRKLQVGDELLQINDRTVSRLTFDEIMDFIIDADPESVNLLFRRPRKETLQVRQGEKLNAAVNKEAPSTVKWVDEESSTEIVKPKKEKKSEKRSDRKKSKRSKNQATTSEEDDTIQSSMAGSESYARGRRKKGRSKRGPYETESFLDMLIDTICSNSGNVCRDGFRKADEYYSDEESFNSDQGDESTYVTYDDSTEKRDKKKRSQKREETIYEGDEEESDGHRRSRRREKAEKLDPLSAERNPNTYEDDGTLQTEESNDRVKLEEGLPPTSAPLGLLPVAPSPAPLQIAPLPVQAFTEVEHNPAAPIREVEYDDRLEADVSVMESLGGPSLLIEKQRAAHATQRGHIAPVPSEVTDEFGLDFPADFGKSRVETIQEDPLKFYTYVVKSLLEEHEPEKVRLLDKLLAKYKGREDHLVQKLSVRYNRTQEEQEHDDRSESEDHDEVAFSDAVKKSKESHSATLAVNTAKERMQSTPMEQPLDHPPYEDEWPEKEQKEPDPEDEEEERSETASEYSGESVDGTSPAVIAQVSELLNYVYGKTSVPGQIDRVSTIMRAYEGREAVLLELLETKALIKANKEKENADNLPAFLRNSAQLAQARQSADGDEKLPAVTPMAQVPGGIHDDMSSMSGVSSPAVDRDHARNVNVSASQGTEEAERPNYGKAVLTSSLGKKDSMEAQHDLLTSKSGSKPPTTPAAVDKKKKKGIFGGLFGKRKGKEGAAPSAADRAGSRQRSRKMKGSASVEASI
jgi:hypothetical protein